MTARPRPVPLATPHLDGLRIVAAAAIVVLHYTEYTKSNPAAHFVFTHAQHLNLLVDLFFVISGYVIATQYAERVGDVRSIARFLWRRLARIYPLHLATLAFYLVIAAVAHLNIAQSDNAARYPMSDMPAQLLLLHSLIGERLTFNFPSWSISAEMFCYLLFPVMAALLLPRRSLAIYAFLVAIAANSAYAIMADTGPWTEWINRGGAFRALPSFLLGFALYRFRDGIGRQPGMRIPLTPVLLAFLIFGSALPPAVQLAMTYLIALLALRLDVTQRNSLFAYFGFERWSHLTYSIYMLHIPVATVILSILGRYVSSVIPDGKLALVPLAIVVLAVASHLSCRFFETPLRQGLSSLFDRKFIDADPAPAFASRSDAR